MLSVSPYISERPIRSVRIIVIAHCIAFHCCDCIQRENIALWCARGASPPYLTLAIETITAPNNKQCHFDLDNFGKAFSLNIINTYIHKTDTMHGEYIFFSYLFIRDFRRCVGVGNLDRTSFWKSINVVIHNFQHFLLNPIFY